MTDGRWKVLKWGLPRLFIDKYAYTSVPSAMPLPMFRQQTILPGRNNSISETFTYLQYNNLAVSHKKRCLNELTLSSWRRWWIVGNVVQIASLASPKNQLFFASRIFYGSRLTYFTGKLQWNNCQDSDCTGGVSCQEVMAPRCAEGPEG